MRATGYEHEEEVVFCYQGQIITHKTTKHYAPDVAAIAIWLKNRRPDKWKDKQDVETHTAPALRMQDLQSSVKRYRDAGQ